jgi:peptide deformylase
MALRDILLYPNPILRQPCAPVLPEEIASPRIQQIIRDMVETMYHHEGTVGLAAPQIGEPIQILVMDSTVKTTRDRLFVMINPTIVQQSQWKYAKEGCLSFPDYLVTVKRARKVITSWHNPDGSVQEDTLQGFEAVIFQHELDHLQGILFIDRLKNMQTDLVHRQTGLPVSL